MCHVSVLICLFAVWSIVYAGVIPFLILLVWAAVARPGVHKTQVTILGLLVALMLSTFLTDVIKNAVGRPRPDLISRCKPIKGTPKDVLVKYTVCTQINDHILQEGWRSFPSGHSSFAFSGLGYLFLYVSPPGKKERNFQTLIANQVKLLLRPNARLPTPDRSGSVSISPGALTSCSLDRHFSSRGLQT